jgi:flagellar biosynthesis protein FlhG
MAGTNQQDAASILTVASGKGGVGKTNISVSLSLALCRAGKRVILLDMDLGLANVDVVLGVRSTYHLKDVIEGNKEITEIITRGPMGLGFISGGPGDEDLANISKASLRRLTESLQKLSWLADYIIIDTSAGLSRNTMSFTKAADEVIVVTTPEPTALVDAYALMKSILQDMPEQNLRLLVNMARNEKDATQIIKRLSMVVKSFSSRSLQHAAFLPYDDEVGTSVRKRKSFYLENPESKVSLAIQDFAKRVLVDGKLLRKQRQDKGAGSELLHRLLKAFR